MTSSAPPPATYCLEVSLVAGDGERRLGVPEVLEDDHVEGVELGVEDLVHREGDERELPLGVAGLGVVARGAEDVERDQVYVGILPEKPSQEALVPARSSHHQQHAHPVADHLQHEGAAVVLGHRLAGEHRRAHRVDEAAGLVGGEGEGDRSPLVVLVQVHRAGAHREPLALEHHRDVAPLEPAGMELEVHGHRVADEGEVVHLHALDREVHQRRLSDPDGGDREAERTQLLALPRLQPGLQLGVVRAVGEEDGPGELAAAPGVGGLQRPERRHEVGPASGSRHAQRLRGHRAELGREAEHLDLVAVAERLQARSEPFQRLRGRRRAALSVGADREAHARAPVHQDREPVLHPHLRQLPEPRLEQEEERHRPGQQPEREEDPAPGG